MSKKFLILSIFLIGLVGCADAMNITLSDITMAKNTKVLVYTADGRLIGEFNSTDTIKLNSSQDYIFVLKPAPQNWFSNPLNALELFKLTWPEILGYALFLLVIVGTIGVVLKRVFF